MHDIDFKRQFIDHIKMQPVVKTISHRQFAIRCPFCGDSKKNPRDTHFYIKVDTDDDNSLILYNCFRASCQMGGIVDNEVLVAMGIYDLKLSGAIMSYNKKAIKNNKHNIQISEKSLELNVPPIRRDDPITLQKKAYLEQRLGTELSFETLERLKVIFRLGDLINLNKIPTITCDKDKALDLDKNYVGFLSVYDEKIIMRQVMESKYGRYENYTIDKNIMNVKKFYSIPVVIDLMTSQPIEINIAEGVLDILGIYFNVHNGGKLNSLYLAATGANFRSVIDYILRLGFNSNVILNIYSDAEVPVETYSYVYKNYSEWFDKINIYYNELSKDTGVPANQIKLIKKKPKWIK